MHVCVVQWIMIVLVEVDFFPSSHDFSRMSWVYFLKYKSEAFENFRKSKALVKNQSGLRTKTLWTDRAGEFLSNEFGHLCEESGIHKDLTAHYSPKQNGVAERKNHIYWSSCNPVYLLNLSPTKVVWWMKHHMKLRKVQVLQ